MTNMQFIILSTDVDNHTYILRGLATAQLEVYPMQSSIVMTVPLWWSQDENVCSWITQGWHHVHLFSYAN